MLKWTLIALLVLALGIFFERKENRVQFLALIKRFWISLLISFVVIAFITVCMLIQSNY